MEEKENSNERFYEYLLESILWSKHGGGSNISFVAAPIEISASPEEGVLSNTRVSSVSNNQNCAPLLSTSQLEWQTLEL